MSHHTIEQLKLVLGAEGWKAFMAELAAARRRGRDVVVEELARRGREKEGGEARGAPAGGGKGKGQRVNE